MSFKLQVSNVSVCIKVVEFVFCLDTYKVTILSSSQWREGRKYHPVFSIHDNLLEQQVAFDSSCRGSCWQSDFGCLMPTLVLQQFQDFLILWSDKNLGGLFVRARLHACVCSIVPNSETPWTVAHQAPPRGGAWNSCLFQARMLSRLPFPPLADLPNPGIKPTSPVSLALAGEFFTTEPPGKPRSKVRIGLFGGIFLKTEV